MPMTAAQARTFVKRLAATSGLTVEVKKYRNTSEVLVTCKAGHCWVADCHQRVFEADSVPNAWQAAAESMQWLSDNQEPCTADTCVGWDAGACGWWRGDWSDLVEVAQALNAHAQENGTA